MNTDDLINVSEQLQICLNDILDCAPTNIKCEILSFVNMDESLFLQYCKGWGKCFDEFTDFKIKKDFMF